MPFTKENIKNYKRGKRGKNKIPPYYILEKSVKEIIQDKSISFIEKAFELCEKDPKTYQVLYNKLLDKIAPTLSESKNENINRDVNYEEKIKEIIKKAEQMTLLNNKTGTDG